jgi:hypothetical protein
MDTIGEESPAPGFESESDVKHDESVLPSTHEEPKPTYKSFK